MKTMTKNFITNIFGWISIGAGIASPFILETNAVMILITLVVIGIGLIYYKNELFQKLIGKIK